MNDDESIQAIQRRMQQVRHELSEEVDDLMASAREMTDWRNYVRAYPWAFAAAAVAAGYFLVPRGARRVRLLPRDLAQLGKAEPSNSEKSGNPGIARALTKVVAVAALRGILGYVGQRIARTTIASGAREPSGTHM